MILASYFALPARARDALLIGAAITTLAAFSAFAEEVRKPADPIVEEVAQSLSPDGIRDRQLRAIKALADAYEREKARADAAEAKLKEKQ